MGAIPTLILGALIFAACFAVDKLFTKFFRSQAQHHSGTAVRLSKGYAIAGLALLVLSALVLTVQMEGSQALRRFCAALLLAVGAGLTGYFLRYGIFYDKETFLFTPFLGKSRTYSYRNIRGQLLYRTNSAILIELHMQDGTTVTVHSSMPGAYAFLDTAFAGWRRQNGLDSTPCPFHDPQNHLWFPTMNQEEN